VRHGKIALEIEIEKYFRLLIPQGLKPHEEDRCSYPNKADRYSFLRNLDSSIQYSGPGAFLP